MQSSWHGTLSLSKIKLSRIPDKKRQFICVSRQRSTRVTKEKESLCYFKVFGLLAIHCMAGGLPLH
jgi:hypothetical protein